MTIPMIFQVPTRIHVGPPPGVPPIIVTKVPHMPAVARPPAKPAEKVEDPFLEKHPVRASPWAPPLPDDSSQASASVREAVVAHAPLGAPEETLSEKHAVAASESPPDSKPASRALLSVENGAWERDAVILSERFGSEAEIFGAIKARNEEKALAAIKANEEKKIRAVMYYLNSIMHMGF